jgi:hypothetical protein
LVYIALGYEAGDLIVFGRREGESGERRSLREDAEGQPPGWQVSTAREARWPRIVSWSKPQGLVRWHWNEGRSKSTTVAAEYFRVSFGFAMPLWTVAVVCGMWPACSFMLRAARIMRRTRRRRAGRCIACGYDLRGIPSRGETVTCPECGVPAVRHLGPRRE